MMTRERISNLLFACGSSHSVLPPTALYNEGWMLRLVLDWFSGQATHAHPLSFAASARWCSEALLGSQFRARHRGDPLAEAWTHADGVIGHFSIRAGRGDLRLETDARQLVVAEAKLYSGLSAGTTRARTFNQAARNVACIAELVADRELQSFERLAFCVVAPESQISAGLFGTLCDRDHMAMVVEDRVRAYGGEKDRWHRECFAPLLSRIELHVLSWESIIEHISSMDSGVGYAIGGFYASCVEFNRPKSIVTRRSAPSSSALNSTTTQ